jgi:hypothetical protein
VLVAVSRGARTVDEYWAHRVLDTVLADRAEQYPGERAVSMAADDEQVCRPGCVDEHRGRVTFDHTDAHRHRRWHT